MIERGAIPAGFAAVLTGHLHRAQILRRNLAAPVIYPGSVERTSFVEREETKGYYLLRFEPGEDGGRLHHARFVPLPARPMRVLAVEGPAIEQRVREGLDACETDAVVRVELTGEPAARFNAARLRALAPPTMNVSLAWRNGRAARRS